MNEITLNIYAEFCRFSEIFYVIFFEAIHVGGHFFNFLRLSSSPAVDIACVFSELQFPP